MSDLAGTLHLWPGAAMPHNLESTRRDWAARLAPGLKASALPGMLAAVFSLCGHAHRSTSLLALQALGVQGGGSGRGDTPFDPSAALQRETALEHLRRIALDWPRLLAFQAPLGGASPLPTAAMAAVREAPLLQAQPSAAPDWPAMRRWLQQHWLLQDAAEWLQAWEQEGEAWLLAWAQRHASSGRLAQLLLAAYPQRVPLALQHTPALPLPKASAGWRALADALSADPGLALAPLWHGRPAHTGCWTRQPTQPGAAPGSSWGLLGSRLAELLRLSLPDAPGQAGRGWLRWGACSTGPGRALAWVEMARGLLVHQLRLQASGVGEPLVHSCQVLAPTDWNFHPQGLAAQALAQMPASAADAIDAADAARSQPMAAVSGHHPPGAPAAVRLLMAALDPCVPFQCAPVPAGTAAVRPAPAAEPCDA